MESNAKFGPKLTLPIRLAESNELCATVSMMNCDGLSML